jgi:hypothetical protein
MKVRGTAFVFGKLVEANDADINCYFKWVDKIAPTKPWPPHKIIKGRSYSRDIYVNELDDLWCGVILSSRNTDLSNHVRNVDGVVTVVQEKDGNPSVDINFFCLRKDSLKGVYSHYDGSYPFSIFLKDLWGAYACFVHEKKREAASSPERSETKLRINKLYSLQGHGTYAPLYDPEEFIELVKRMSEIHELRFTTWAIESTTDAPVKADIKSVHSVYKLLPQRGPTDGILSWIRSKRSSATRHLKSGKNRTSGSLSGILDDGPITINFDYNLSDHLEYEHDKIGTIDTTKLCENPCMKKMIQTIREKITFKPFQSIEKD